ncbi:E3 ubiquitin-protein ligase RNF34-like isoform X2 [Ostrea edulis]|uniref:E3 ubiquitin-protein ligase RNF34-like isoform X2 n=1 Tax=Ostrea edulis TaxID=37623 RepID=UPI0024AFE55A|nr:E3 ubiquitin-protein ligase RNF34-like isoform X2 [Ostrea edulis]XP_055996792.1 E3 ubiquitin-protein ligase RNF34-like isoform X2 [Ostrea edulis]
MGQGASLIRNDIHTTHVYTTSQRNSNLTNRGRPTSPEMVCESCNASFNIFNRKKLCKDCGRHFCANCVMHLQDSVKRSHRQCKKCNILTSGNFTRQDLQKWKVKDLRSLLDKRNISTEACTEKHDLIDLLVITFGVVNQSHSGERSSSSAQTSVKIQGNRGNLQEHGSMSSNNDERSSRSGSQQNVPSASQTSANSVPPSTSVNNQQRSQSLQEPQAPHVEEPQRSHSLQQNESEVARAERLRQRQQEELRTAQRLMEEMRRLENEHQVQQERTKRYTLDDIKSVDDIETLSVRQMKEVLVNNFVDYKGCVEKTELQQRVVRLWKEHQNNKQKSKSV